jgi:bifunctional non-homologous end joining protein LigD
MPADTTRSGKAVPGTSPAAPVKRTAAREKSTASRSGTASPSRAPSKPSRAPSKPSRSGRTEPETGRTKTGRTEAKTKTDALRAYRAKRDPARTPEPPGSRAGTRTGRQTFVIQEHHARSLHWDLRLERGGVLVSWALPKGLPESPEKNHLAVHTEDHPLEYATFEGDIPRGEYGGGTVAIWDTGHYEVEKWTETEVKFDLYGARAAGSYVLFRTKDRNWMIHRHGASTRTDPLPNSLKPMLATAGNLPVENGSWAFEIKWDGIRVVLFVEGGRVRAVSRNDLDVTASFPELADVGEFLGMTTCVLDGEVVALGEDGRPDFARLQRRMHVSNQREARRRAGVDPVSFVAFDLLYIDGHSLLDSGYDERRARLESLNLSGPTFTTTESFRDVSGEDILAATAANGLEGVVAKRRDSVYRPGRRSTDWVKVKTFRSQEVVIGGWTEGRGEREGELGALLLGVPDDGAFRYVGKVGTGFNASDRRALLAELRPLTRKTCPFTPPLSAPEAAGAHYVQPALVGEVRFSEWTAARRLRQPAWRGRRPDKDPSEVVEE